MRTSKIKLSHLLLVLLITLSLAGPGSWPMLASALSIAAPPAARFPVTSASPVQPLAQTPSCTPFGLDQSFGVGGKVATSFPGGLDTANDVAVQADGKIVVAGSSGTDFALTRYNTNGTLDVTFGTGGRVNTDFPTGMGGLGNALVIQPDGKIVVAGQATDPAVSTNSGFALVRYNTNGTLDTSFDGDGRVVTGFPSSFSTAEDILIQPDGKLVVAGTSTSDTTFNSVFALARYNTDGSLDNSFDGDGRVTTDIPGLTFELGEAVALQANGRIVVSGRGLSAFVLTRYNTNGSLDTGTAGDSTPADSFGTGGIVTTTFGGSLEEARALAIQSDGKIVAAGSTELSVTSNDNFALARYNTDGSLDPTFDGDGKVTTDFGLVDFGYAVVIQPDGHIVAAGGAGTTAAGSFFALARYNTNGSLDNTFDGDGKVLTDSSGGRFSIGALGVALQLDGRIVAAGDNNISGQRDFGVTRYNFDGSLDANFGTGGQVITDFPLNDETISDMVVQPDGKIVAAGRFNTQFRIANTQDLNFMLARYNPDGSLDQSFGSGGLVSTGFGVDGDDSAYAMALQPDGKIIVVGQVGPHFSQAGANDTAFGIARYNSNGTLDTTFDGDGKVTTDFGTSADLALAVAVQSNGRIVVAGTSAGNFAVARYNTNGSLDSGAAGDSTPGDSFGVGGKTTTDFGGGADAASAVVIQTSGKIVAAGTGLGDFALARYNIDGTLDTGTFGVSGKVTTDFSSGSDSIAQLVIQPDGKLVAAGFANLLATGSDFAIARYSADGVIDSAGFGTGGKTTTDFGGFDQAGSLALQADGKVVVAGLNFPIPAIPGGAREFFALARYNTNGIIDSGFGSSGKITTDLFGLTNLATAVVIQGDGKIVAGGSADTGSSNDFALTRYNVTCPLSDVSIAVSPSSTAEDGATNLVYTFSRTGDTSGSLTVNFSVGGSATFSTDYSQSGAATFTSSTGTVTFAAGSSTATVTVDPTTDSSVEPDETVLLTVTSGTGYNVGSPSVATGTITNDDADVSVAVSPSSIAEDGATNLVYTFSRAGNTATPLTVNFSVGGTATFNTDYSQSGASTFTSSSGTVTFAAGSSTALVTIDPATDSTVEPNETVILTVTSGTGYNVGSPSAASGTINDDDTDVSVAVSPLSAAEDGATNLVYTFSRNGSTSGALTVNFSVGGTAVFNTDYSQSGAASFTSSSGTVTFAAGNSTATVTVDPTADGTVEPDETVILTVTSGSGYNVSSPSTATGTINNDDIDVSVAVSPQSAAEDSATNLVYTFSRAGNTGAALTVNFSVSGTATFNNDYSQTGAATFTSSNGTLTFGAGNSTATVTIDPTADGTVEPDETVILTVTSGSGYNVGSPSAATGTISNDDGTPGLSINDISVTEGNGGTINAAFTVTLSAPSSSTVTVNFATADGTATQPGDYQSTAGLLTFNPGDTTKSITVVVNGDVANEPNETFFVNLSGPVNATISDNQGLGTILNDDTPQFNFSLANYSVSESGGSALITVNRTGDPGVPVTVDFMTTDNSNPADFVLCSSSPSGTASSRCDFNTALGTLRFASGETSKTFNVLITQDSYVEGAESLQLFLSNPTGGAVLGTLSNSTLQILDDVPETSTNPILDARNFVRQHYHDFLNREPDQPGWDFWTDNITKCNDPARRPAGQSAEQCIDKQRETTSGAFFLSPEFQYTGFYIYCVYKGSLGRMPTFLELMRDVQQVSRDIIVANAISGATIEQNRAQFEAEFIQRQEFIGIYGALNNQAYVDKLFLTTGSSVSSADKQALVNGLNGGTETRATVLHKVVNGTRVISEGQADIIAPYGKTFTDAQFNPAFVQMEYLGYLRRNSDAAGFTFWRDKMNSFGGDFLKAEMVKSFLMSPEYLQRFAAP